MHASRMPHPMDYAPLILTMKTSQRNCCYLVCEPDNCYQFKTFALLMYSRGVSPRIPSKPMMSQCPHGICLHCLILIIQSVAQPANQCSVFPVSQSVFSLWSGHAPHRLHKPWNMPCSLHSDSDQQKNNINRTQPLTSSTFNTDNLLHQHVASARLSHSLHQHSSSTIHDYQLHQHIIICFQGKCFFFFNAHRPADSMPLILEIIFLLFPISDGSI